jgi:elongation factor P hydroxylase
MPMEIPFIDAIAREKGRDVLYLAFEEGRAHPGLKHVERIEVRRQIIEWLGANDVGWALCGDVASETEMRSYAGQLYLDVPFDSNDQVYQKVQAFLEHPDGTMRFEGV